jgi:CheY-like chemotaxis protein
MSTSTSQPLNFSCLIVSIDPNTIREIANSATELAIFIHEWNGFADLASLLNHRKFEAVVIDYRIANEMAGEAIRLVRQSASNKSAVVLAITESDQQITSAFAGGANLTIKRPLTHDSILKTLKLAYGSMIRERRRYFRCVITVPANIEQDDVAVSCQTINISEGGMAVIHGGELRPDNKGIVRFHLPDLKHQCIAEAIVRWAKTGMAGIQYVSLTSQHKAELQAWLAQRLEEQLPESVRAQFKKEDDV